MLLENENLPSGSLVGFTGERTLDTRQGLGTESNYHSNSKFRAKQPDKNARFESHLAFTGTSGPFRGADDQLGSRP